VKILNKDNQQIFEYFGNNLLDSICSDSWNLIINYYYSHAPIKIGTYDAKYPGYRIIKDAECNTQDFKKLFTEQYNKNKIGAFDKISYNYDWVSIRSENHHITSNNFPLICNICVRFITKFATKGGWYEEAFNINSPLSAKEYYSHTTGKVSLFIADQIRLY